MVGLLYNLALTLPLIAGFVMLFVTVPIMASKYERHHTFASKELAVMLKLTFFQVFNLVVAAAAFLFDPSVRDFTRNWYALGGALVVSTMLGDAFFIQVAYFGVR